MPCGEDRKGNLRSPPIAALKQFSLLPAWSGGYPTRKRSFHDDEACASASGLKYGGRLPDYLPYGRNMKPPLNGEGDSGRLCWPGPSY